MMTLWPHWCLVSSLHGGVQRSGALINSKAPVMKARTKSSYPICGNSHIDGSLYGRMANATASSLALSGSVRSVGSQSLAVRSWGVLDFHMAVTRNRGVAAIWLLT